MIISLISVIPELQLKISIFYPQILQICLQLTSTGYETVPYMFEQGS